MKTNPRPIILRIKELSLYTKTFEGSANTKILVRRWISTYKQYMNSTDNRI